MLSTDERAVLREALTDYVTQRRLAAVQSEMNQYSERAAEDRRLADVALELKGRLAG